MGAIQLINVMLTFGWEESISLEQQTPRSVSKPWLTFLWNSLENLENRYNHTKSIDLK